jgi:tRNA C32,U32 (ribose-2'-O)-methylase TrmJ
MTRLYEHIEQVLDYIDFRDRHGGGHLMARIRRLFNRARLDQNEMNILRGILTAVQARRRPALPPKRAGIARANRDVQPTEKTD